MAFVAFNNVIPEDPRWKSIPGPGCSKSEYRQPLDKCFDNTYLLDCDLSVG